jgi:hypothetical protein
MFTFKKVLLASRIVVVILLTACLIQALIAYDAAPTVAHFQNVVIFLLLALWGGQK